MDWTCEFCDELMNSANKARHIQRKHPERFQPQSNKGDSMCPICHKIMHKTHVKRHMISVHKADDNINIGQIKKQLVDTVCSIKDFSNQCSLSVPLHWIFTFIVLDKLWKTKKYVETSDVISSMFKFLKKIEFKPVGDFKEHLQSLSCYCYIKFVTTTRIIEDCEQEGCQVLIKHITKGKMYPKLLRQIHSNAGTFHFWRICQRMSLKTPVMRFNKEQFKEQQKSERSDSQCNHSEISENLEQNDGCMESSIQEEVQEKCFTIVFNQFDESLWELKKQFDQYCLNGIRVKSFLDKLNKFGKKEEFLLLLKICPVCKQKFTQNEMKRVKCIYCSTQLHEECSRGLEKCDCQSSGTQLKRISEEKLLQTHYKTQTVAQGHLLRRKAFQGISTFKPKTSQEEIEAEEEIIKKALKERNSFIYCTNGRIFSEFEMKIDLKTDPFLLEADQQLTKAYRSYASGSFKPPLKLKVHGEDNLGIQTLEMLPKMTLLGEYAADIIPSIYCPQVRWKDHLMLYYQGATSTCELMLAPFNICNFGPLLNHSHKPNCASLRVIIDNSIRVLLFTTRKIKAGQELFYDYNGLQHQYPTDDFQQLND